MRRLLDNGAYIVLFLTIILLLEYYTFITFKLATKRLPKKIKVVLYILYALFNLGFYIILVNGEYILNPKNESVFYSIFVALVLGVFGGKIIVSVIMLLGDVYRLFKYVFSGKAPQVVENKETQTVDLTKKTISRSTFLSQIGLLTGGIVFGSLLNGTTNKYNYKVNKFSLKFPNLPQKFNGLRIAHITDIHSGSFDNPDAVARGVEMILEQKPDMILVTGDVVNNRHEELLPYQNIFSRLHAPMGVFVVLGNHDYGDYEKWNSEEEKKDNLIQLKNIFKIMNWEILSNQHIVFDNEGDRIALIGVENWSSKDHFPKHGDLEKATQGLVEKNPAFQILMSHDPSHWDAKVVTEHKDIDLTLSGHTHGMQFGVRLPWMQWSPVQYVYKHWLGQYRKGSQVLYVNPGFGFIGYRGRVGIMPEIAIIELNQS